MTLIMFLPSTQEVNYPVVALIPDEDAELLDEKLAELDNDLYERSN